MPVRSPLKEYPVCQFYNGCASRCRRTDDTKGPQGPHQEETNKNSVATADALPRLLLALRKEWSNGDDNEDSARKCRNWRMIAQPKCKEGAEIHIVLAKEQKEFKVESAVYGNGAAPFSCRWD